MNQKTPQDLDPKLKEAYERVMGGNFTPSSPTQTLTPKTETVPTQTASTMPASNPLPNPAFAANPLPPPDVMSPSSTPQKEEPLATAKKKSKLTPLIFLVVGIVFFVIYALVWGKLFKLY